MLKSVSLLKCFFFWQGIFTVHMPKKVSWLHNRQYKCSLPTNRCFFVWSYYLKPQVSVDSFVTAGNKLANKCYWTHFPLFFCSCSGKATPKTQCFRVTEFSLPITMTDTSKCNDSPFIPIGLTHDLWMICSVHVQSRDTLSVCFGLSVRKHFFGSWLEFPGSEGLKH